MADWQRVSVDSRSHSRLAAICRETQRPVRGVVVCAHPMGLACKGFWLRYGHAARLLDLGFHVLAYDFNGFGESPSTNFDYPGDAIAAGRFARARWPGLPVHAFGASFGAMKTLDAISEAAFPYERVVAEGCAPSLPQFWRAYPAAHAVLEVARRIAPRLEERLRPLAQLPRMKPGTRLLLVHSHGDRWSPVAHGDALAAAAPAGARVERLVLQRADHTHGLRDEADTYWPAVSRFLLAD
jgi:pimeloyl-ACP methyl ester carboxylesterase